MFQRAQRSQRAQPCQRAQLVGHHRLHRMARQHRCRVPHDEQRNRERHQLNVSLQSMFLSTSLTRTIFPPRSECTETTDLAKIGVDVIASVKINNENVSPDTLARSFAVSRLPAKISIVFKRVCEHAATTCSRTLASCNRRRLPFKIFPLRTQLNRKCR